MPEPTGSDVRVQALRRRWETEKSTAFLPLAEEYRRLGRLREAIEVLEVGLKANPGYTSGLVALGRCRLESGDSDGAAAVLERVVAQDPEQLVASKLLIEAYLRTRRARDARSRLDAYSRLNSKDPEILRLEQRLAGLAASEAPAPTPIVAEPPALPAAPPAVEEPEPLPAIEESVASAPPEPPAPLAAKPLSPPLPPAAAQTAVFVGLDGPAIISRYLRGLAIEGLFPLAFPQPVALRSVAVVAEVVAEAEEIAVPPEPVGEEKEPFERDVERAISAFVSIVPAPVEPLAPTGSAVERSAAPPPEPPGDSSLATDAATTTLADLYLRQGHAADAERIFGSVLERDPANDVARRGLNQAQEVLRQTPGGLSSRRAGALRDYLRRLRGGASHVS